jgi:hypothetical protein
VWSMSHTSAGASQPGNRHVRSRQRTNRANAAEGRYPGSQIGSGRGTCLNWAVAAISRSIGAGTAPKPGMYPGACELPSIVACSAMTSITTCPNGCWSAPAGHSFPPQPHSRRVWPAAIALMASARRCCAVRESSRHTVPAISSRRASNAAPSAIGSLAQIPAMPGLIGPTSTYRSSRVGRGSRTPLGSNFSAAPVDRWRSATDPPRGPG